ncbi:MAG: hypothetical protein PHX21_04860 [bacterium]|nr:hypothetical protein [bacterium]
MNTIILNILLCVTAPYEDITCVNVGAKFGYQYESIQLKEWHKTSNVGGFDTTISATGSATEAKTLMGFGGEIMGEFVFAVPGLPIGFEVNAGSYVSSFSGKDSVFGIDSVTKYEISSTRVGILGRIFIRNIPSVYPWIGAGPFFGFNTHSIKASTNESIYNENVAINSGITGEVGARIWIPQVPKLSADAGIRFDYFTSSKSTFAYEDSASTEYTREGHYSQWNIRLIAGVTYAIKW